MLNLNTGHLLHSAIYLGCKEIAKLLIDNGADVNANYDDGDSPYDQGDHVLLLVYPV